MTRQSGSSGTAVSTQQLQAEVEQARQGLADTVAALAGKADVKSRAREKASRARTRMTHMTGRALDKGRGNSTSLAAGSGAAALALAASAAYAVRHRHQHRHPANAMRMRAVRARKVMTR